MAIYYRNSNGQSRVKKTNSTNLMRIYQNRNRIRAIYCDEFIPVIKKNVDNSKGLIKGELYSLQTVGCDGFTMSEKVYEMREQVLNYGKYELNCAVVKQVSGPISTIFELTRNICSDLHIDYEERLQLLPLSLNWKHIEREMDKQDVEFNHEDLSTHPTQGGYVNYIIVRIGGFSSFRPTHIITSNGRMLKTQDFLRSLKIVYRYDIDGDKDEIELGDDVNFSIITSEIEQIICDNSGHLVSDKRNGYICDAHGDIYIRVDLVGKNILPEMMKNKSASDIFSISWLENTPYDVNYESQFKPIDEALQYLGKTFSQNSLTRNHNDEWREIYDTF